MQFIYMWSPAQLNPQLTKAGGPISREIESITTGAGEGPNRVDATLRASP